MHIFSVQNYYFFLNYANVFLFFFLFLTILMLFHRKIPGSESQVWEAE